ncbi:MAG: hypothetical protein LLG06_14245 [Desulfobacteraceae bacterium]|nr:hypothetical protein [Desulfobacteraceae bacterium]
MPSNCKRYSEGSGAQPPPESLKTAFGLTNGSAAHFLQNQAGQTEPQPDPTSSKQAQLRHSAPLHPEHRQNSDSSPQTMHSESM